ncbi:MAG: substrate-binding domain-containing protein, partial [Deltaproteobacteria bacterium]
MPRLSPIPWLLLLAGCHSRPTIRVSAAASLEAWLPTELSAFRSAHPGTPVEDTYGGSGALERQIEGGAPIAIFLSASPREVARLDAL